MLRIQRDDDRHRDPLGTGTFLLDYNDVIVNETRTNCVSAAGADCGLFVLCASDVIGDHVDFPKLCEDGG